MSLDFSKLQAGDVVYRRYGWRGYTSVTKAIVSKVTKTTVSVKTDDGEEFRYTMKNARWGEKRETWSSVIDKLISEAEGRELKAKQDEKARLKKMWSDSNAEHAIRLMQNAADNCHSLSREKLQEVVDAMRATLSVLEAENH